MDVLISQGLSFDRELNDAKNKDGSAHPLSESFQFYNPIDNLWGDYNSRPKGTKSLLYLKDAKGKIVNLTTKFSKSKLEAAFGIVFITTRERTINAQSAVTDKYVLEVSLISKSDIFELSNEPKRPNQTGKALVLRTETLLTNQNFIDGNDIYVRIGRSYGQNVLFLHSKHEVMTPARIPPPPPPEEE
jgi:hypothetical protein